LPLLSIRDNANHTKGKVWVENLARTLFGSRIYMEWKFFIQRWWFKGWYVRYCSCQKKHTWNNLYVELYINMTAKHDCTECLGCAVSINAGKVAYISTSCIVQKFVHVASLCRNLCIASHQLCTDFHTSWPDSTQISAQVGEFLDKLAKQHPCASPVSSLKSLVLDRHK
jgi:hypothetical protein